MIKELFEIAGRDVPKQVEDRDEIRDELAELNEGSFLFLIISEICLMLNYLSDKIECYFEKNTYFIL